MTDETLETWIGRTRETGDEITLPALRRIAALLDRDDDFAPGTPIPPHWYAMFFPDIAPQRDIGRDGHPRRGDFLPPVALPRRMFAGRRVRFHAPLHVGETARKTSRITAITPKTGRSGDMVFVTIRHEIAVGGELRITEDQDVVYRGDARAAAAPPAAAPASPEADPAWHETWTATPVMLFRYSAITFNGHRIHYDADYVRDVEGYPGLVVNGGLTLLMLTEAAIRAYGQPPTGIAVRNLRPLFAGADVRLCGGALADGQAKCRAEDAAGNHAVDALFQFDDPGSPPSPL